MSGAPFDKKKEDAGVPFEMGGELPDFLTAIPTEESTGEVDNVAPVGEAPPMMPDFTMGDESIGDFENFGEGTDGAPDFSTFGDATPEADVVSDLSPPDFLSDASSGTVPDFSFDTPPDFSGENAQPEPPASPTPIFTQAEPPDIAAPLPDISNITPAPPFPDFEVEISGELSGKMPTELSGDVAPLVLPGTESMEVYTPEGIHMPEHEISAPTPQFPPMAEALPAMAEPVPSPLSVELPPPAEIPPQPPFCAPPQLPQPVFEVVPEPVPPAPQPVTSPTPQPSASPFPPVAPPAPQVISPSPQQPAGSPFPASEPPVPQTMSVPSQQLPVEQAPYSSTFSSTEFKRDLISRLQWIVRTFMATGHLKTRLRSLSKETEPPQAAPVEAPSLSASQSPSPQLSPTSMASTAPEIAHPPVVPAPQPDESIKQMSGHVNEIDSVIGSLSSIVSSMDSRIDAVSAISSPSPLSPSPPTSSIAEVNHEVVENIVDGILSEKLSSMNAFADNVAGEVSALKESVLSLKNTTESNRSMLVEVSNMQSTISDIQMAISEKIDEFGNLTEINTGDISETSAQIKVASESLESLSATVSALLDDVSTTLSTTAEIEEIIGRLQVDKISVDELSEFMDSVHQQIQEMTASVSTSASVIGGVGGTDILSRSTAVKLLVIKNEPPFVKLCMEWLEFLLELVGNNNLPDILEYYAGIGWISDDIRLELILMARGMDNYAEKDDWKLHPDDHLKSLWFIEQLCGIKVDRFTMQQIDRDISKMKGGLDTLYNI